MQSINKTIRDLIDSQRMIHFDDLVSNQDSHNQIKADFNMILTWIRKSQRTVA